MIESDERERIFYDVLSILELDIEQLGNYWSTLIDRFKLMGDEEPNPLCKNCNSSEVFQNKDSFICKNSVKVKYGTEKDEKTGEVNIVPIAYEQLDEEHEIIYETPMQTIKRIVKETMEYLTEVDGYVPSLDEIEISMLGKYSDCFFETEHGEVTKSQIAKRLNQITRFVNERMGELQEDIMFTGQYQSRRK